MLELSHVGKSYGEKIVLQDRSACFSQGIYAVTGPSGAGKTTLLRIIAGLETYTGTVTGAGRISYLFQEPRLFPWYTAQENVALVSDRDTAHATLTAVGLEKEPPAYPHALLLDEPLAGLDEKTAKSVLALIWEKAQKKTVLFVTHDPVLAETMDGRFAL